VIPEISQSKTRFGPIINNGGTRWCVGCVQDCQVNERSEVQTPARTTFWIEISAPYTHSYSVSGTTS